MESLVKYLLLRPAQRHWDTTPLRVIKSISSPPLIPHPIRVFSKEDESVPTRPRGKSNFFCYTDSATENRLEREAHVSEASNVFLATTAFSGETPNHDFKGNQAVSGEPGVARQHLCRRDGRTNPAQTPGPPLPQPPAWCRLASAPGPSLRPPGPHCPQLLTEPTPVRRTLSPDIFSSWSLLSTVRGN